MSVFKTIRVTYRDGKTETFAGWLWLWPGTYLIKRWFRTVAAIPFSAVRKIDVSDPRRIGPHDIKRTGY